MCSPISWGPQDIIIRSYGAFENSGISGKKRVHNAGTKAEKALCLWPTKCSSLNDVIHNKQFCWILWDWQMKLG